MIYKYETRYIVEFTNKTRASYSKKRYGPLLEDVCKLAEQLDKKIWNYFECTEDSICIYYWEQKTQSVKEILIDIDQERLVYEYYWQLNANGYPQTRTNGQKIFLHRMIMNTNQMVDHINHNPLDNRMVNLRICNSCSDNNINQTIGAKNTSGHVGVWFDSDRKTKPWRGRFQYKHKEHASYFDTYDEACSWVDLNKQYIIAHQKTFND